MNRKFFSLVLGSVMALSLLTACAPKPAANAGASSSASSAAQSVGDTSQSHEPELVTITDFDGNEVTLMQNPKRVAIYDYAVLDILESVGFENTGIEMLIVPTKDTLPQALSFYKEQSDDLVVTGGSLFYVDWDVLDIVQPELVILGARSFGMNAAGERLSAEDNAAYRADTQQRYGQAVFAKLSFNSRNSDLLVDMQRNVTALAAIFPDLAPQLEEKFAEIVQEMEALQLQAQSSGQRALFAMMVDPTNLSVFLPESRFDMIYEEFGFESAAQEAVEWTDQHGFDVKAEYVLEVNPDVIFLLDRSATVGSGAGAENFINDPIISKTQAAQNGHIYVLSGDAWYTMTGGFTAVETMISDIQPFFDSMG